MNFPTHLHDFWRGKRDNSCNRMLREGFAARFYKIGLRLGIDGVKLPNLHVLKNTVLEKYYLAGTVPLSSQPDNAALVVDFLERLNPGIVMHRLSAAAHHPLTWQGRLYTKAKFRTSLPNMSNEGAAT